MRRSIAEQKRPAADQQPHPVCSTQYAGKSVSPAFGCVFVENSNAVSRKRGRLLTAARKRPVHVASSECQMVETARELHRILWEPESGDLATRSDRRVLEQTQPNHAVSRNIGGRWLEVLTFRLKAWTVNN